MLSEDKASGLVQLWNCKLRSDAVLRGFVIIECTPIDAFLFEAKHVDQHVLG